PERPIASISTSNHQEEITDAELDQHLARFRQRPPTGARLLRRQAWARSRQDVPLGFMRWLTVRVPGDITHEILLEMPGPPAMDEKTAGQVRELVSKGASGFAAGFTTSDVKKTYETLKARGVDITQEPNEHEYGTDFGLRDPFGNHIRIVQLAPTALQARPKQKGR